MKILIFVMFAAVALMFLLKLGADQRPAFITANETNSESNGSLKQAGYVSGGPAAGTDNVTYKDSPFSILGPYEYWMNSREVISKEGVNSLLSDLGVKWVEEMPFERNNLPGNINIYTRVGVFPGISPPNIDYGRYLPLLKSQIESLKDRIKYYEIDTEPSGAFSRWNDNASKYAEFLKQSYMVIKAACPDCYVVLGGLPGAGVGVSPRDPNGVFLTTILNDNASGYFDIFEFKQHFISIKDYRIIKTRMDVYGKILSNYGDNISKMPVFLETAMYDGNPQSPMFNLPSQTETEQAIGLVKTYVYAISIGISKIYWNGVIELYNFGGSARDPFDFYGLVNNVKNDGNSYKKLAYYSYKKMVEILEGSDWKQVTTIKDAGGLFVCRYLKNGKYIWVVWNDNQRPMSITMNVGGLSKVKITKSVPDASSGKQISDYSSAFTTSTVTTNGADLTITIDMTPVYIEESQ
ncbi:MAG: hypothetical protein L7F77_10470 [Candidatus Magnetominusculus sp. LBB02]|nr:hypothetical protein [Candidatus Magnetominusculus sp. LBB02]